MRCATAIRSSGYRVARSRPSTGSPRLAGFEAIRIGQHIARVAELRRQIREAGDDTSDCVLRDIWDEAQVELAQVRLFGDLAVAAFFSGAKTREREAKRSEFAQAVDDGNAERFRGLLEELREAEPPLVPFHWEIELPEVFERERPGFDAIVGNPPFGGKNTSAARIQSTTPTG